MPQTLLVISSGNRGNGLTSVSLGLVRAFQQLQARVGFCKPISQPHSPEDNEDSAIALARLTTATRSPAPLSREEVEHLLGDGEDQVLQELVVARCLEACADDPDVLVVEGLVPVDDAVYGTALNVGMARALDARIVLVGSPEGRGPEEMAAAMSVAARAYGAHNGALLGGILNKVPPGDEDWAGALAAEGIACLGLIPYSAELAAPRIQEVIQALGAEVLREGDRSRRVISSLVAAMTLPNVLKRGMTPDTLLITPGDRVDNLIAAALAEVSGTRLAGLLLTCGVRPTEEALALCDVAPDLPIFAVETDTFDTARAMMSMSAELPRDDEQRAEQVVNAVASAVERGALQALLGDVREPKLSPPAFRYSLIQRARALNKRIILPEGEEPRTLQAAAICARRGIARCVLMGNPEQIQTTARRLGVDLTGVELLDPEAVRGSYVAPLCELRRHKNLHPMTAAGQLVDSVVLGTVMLKLGEVDGLVSGAVHTTANTIRPALQIIKTAPGYSLVSSIFFMCLPEQVLVYGDCAVNPAPTNDELADIAIQSAETAAAFGVTPRIAMISYSTGTSAQSEEVSRVAAATAAVRQRAPELLVDGPLQYDAASVASVGRTKAPDSAVAGRATVYIFPDLNTGNTTYKAVQRSANVVSMGPILQGLDMPVNDLSRGSTVEDIVYTIAITSIQAEQTARRKARADDRRRGDAGPR